MASVPTLFAMKPIKHRPPPSMIVALLALFVALGGAGMAATGGNFILGQANEADQTTGLSVSTLPDATACPAPCEALQVTDISTAANAGGLGVLGNSATTPAATIQNSGGGAALSLLVSAGNAPFAVNSAVRVAKLNADRLDGKSSDQFLQPGGVLGTDIVDGEVKSADVADESLSGIDIATSTLSGTDIATGSITGVDIADSSLSGFDIAGDTVSGTDIAEDTLQVHKMGCQHGKILGFARVKGLAAIPSFYTSSSSYIDKINNCANASVQVRKAGTGLYYVRFNSNPAELAVTAPNADLSPPESVNNDNIITVSKITSGADIGAFRVEVQDVCGDCSGGTDPQNAQFTIALL
jgi:hypothetical protein